MSDIVFENAKEIGSISIKRMEMGFSIFVNGWPVTTEQKEKIVDFIYTTLWKPGLKLTHSNESRREQKRAAEIFREAIEADECTTLRELPEGEK